MMAWSGRRRRGVGRLADLPGTCPVTWLVIGANAVTFLATTVGGVGWPALTFWSATGLAQPWSVITYPLIAGPLNLWLLVSGYMFWLFGGSLERSWGARDYVVFLLLITAAPAISLWVATLLTGQNVVLAGLWLPLAATVVAWAALNPFERLLFYFIIPLQARWLALVVVVLVLFSFRPVLLGFFALAGCGVAWWYARGGKYRLWQLTRGGRRGTMPRVRERRVSLNPLDAVRRWKRKRQFMRLVKRSGLRDLDS